MEGEKNGVINVPDTGSSNAMPSSPARTSLQLQPIPDLTLELATSTHASAPQDQQVERNGAELFVDEIPDLNYPPPLINEGQRLPPLWGMNNSLEMFPAAMLIIMAIRQLVPELVPQMDNFVTPFNRCLFDMFTTIQHLEDLREEAKVVYGVIIDIESDAFRNYHFNPDEMTYEELLSDCIRSGAVKRTRLKPVEIEQRLKSRVYGQSAYKTEELQSCSICWGQYEDYTVLGVLDCGHHFDYGCIELWLEKNNTCPICKQTGLAVDN